MSFFWQLVSKSGGDTSHESLPPSNGRNNSESPSGGIQNLKIESAIEHPRIIEFECGEALNFRNQLLEKLVDSDIMDIGPPDMVHVTEYDKYEQGNIGEHHYITGIDVSNETVPIAYMNTLRLSRGSKLNTDAYAAVFCSYNIFSRVDVRIRFESEKHYQVNIVNLQDRDTSIQLSKKLWDELFVSGCIRSMVMNKDKARKIPGLMERSMITGNGLHYYQKIVSMLCKFLPRSKETGYDRSVYSGITPLQNNLVDSLFLFLSMMPRSIHEFTANLLERLAVEDKANKIHYKLVLLRILMDSKNDDITFVKKAHEVLEEHFPNISSLSQFASAYLVDLLNLEVEFLMGKQDYALALPLAKHITFLISNNFQAWYNLASCYVELERFDDALLAINCMPHFDRSSLGIEYAMADLIDSKYYHRPLGVGPQPTLIPKEFNYLSSTLTNMNSLELRTLVFGRLVMSKPISHGGYIKDIWDGPCRKLGPIYGPHSYNLINFVSETEVSAINDPQTLDRNMLSSTLTPCENKVYYILMEIINRIGWNGFLDIRSKLFVMQHEHTKPSTRLNVEVKHKRLCEKWLDRLFLEIYDDLKLCTDSSLKNTSVMNSGLEWHLLGVTFLRTWYFNEAIACLKTSIQARFDPITAEHLLNLYLASKYHEEDVDVMLSLLTRYSSYAIRFYDMCQSLTMRVLRRLCEEYSKDIIRNRIQALYSNNNAVTSLMDRFLEHIDPE